jgi:drug/metabolite transporter (DMT)-like permease
MKPADLLRLLALAAIWGASFLFFRMAVPSLGVAWFAELRVAIAAVAMLAYAYFAGIRLDARRHWRAYVLMGVLNAALPWSLYAYAGLHLGAGTMSILNASTPFFTALCGAIWLGERLTARKVAALALGVVGVGLVVGLGPIAVTPQALLGAMACIAATLCYAIATTLLIKIRSRARPVALSTATLVVASLSIAPFLSSPPPAGAFSPPVITAVLGVSLLCSALAFVLYFRLLADLGPTRTQTITFLIPVFGVLWGAIFLGEPVGAGTVAGGLTVLAAMVLVIRR